MTEHCEYVRVPRLWLDDVLDVLRLDGAFPDLVDEADRFPVAQTGCVEDQTDRRGECINCGEPVVRVHGEAPLSARSGGES